MTVKANISEIKSALPANVALVAVSKFHPAEAIMGRIMQAKESLARVVCKSLSLNMSNYQKI